MPNLTGGIVDDLLVSSSMGRPMLKVKRPICWLLMHPIFKKIGIGLIVIIQFDTRIINISDITGLLAIQGPGVVGLLQELTEGNKLTSIPYYSFKKGSFAGVDNVLISATGYTGSGGFEIYAEKRKIAHIWNEVFKIGKPKGLYQLV